MPHWQLGHDDVSHATDGWDDSLGPMAHLKSWSDITITIFIFVCFTLNSEWQKAHKNTPVVVILHAHTEFHANTADQSHSRQIKSGEPFS